MGASGFGWPMETFAPVPPEKALASASVVAAAALLTAVLCLFSSPRRFLGELASLYGVGKLGDGRRLLREEYYKKPAKVASPMQSSEGVDTLGAAACWRAEFGRFKFCGLRPDATDDSEEMPTDTVEPLRVPVEALSKKEAADLEGLTARLSDLACTERTDASTLIRYLRSRKGNVREAEKYFREAARWRNKHGIKDILATWNLRAYEQCLAPWWLSGGMLGHGLRGQPIAYERLSRCKWTKVFASLPFEELERLDAVHCARSLAALEEDAIRRGAPLGDGILVEDCAEFDWDQCTLKAVRTLNRLIRNRNMIMPECLTQILVIRAPPAWVHMWNLFKHILEPGIREKVQIAGEGQSLDLLRRYIPDEEIPGYLGGGRFIDGDPECRKVLAPGGPIPKEALERFFALSAKGLYARHGEEKGANDPQGAAPRGPVDTVRQCWGGQWQSRSCCG